MNILFLVGNGLDLQYGLKTRYRDFYDYQIPKYKEKKNENYKNYIYEAIKKDKSNQYCNWSDLEFGIGEISKEYGKENKNTDWGKFVNDFVEVGTDLYKYLSEQDKSFNAEGKTINFRKTLTKLYDDLLEEDSRKLSLYASDKNPHGDDDIRIMTFNYTSVFDRLLKNSIQRMIGTLFNKHSGITLINRVHHAHGALGNNPIFGVSFAEQLSDLMDDETAEEFIKEKIIANCRNGTNQDNTRLIDSADLIIIFGMSIGETDSYIWGKIVKKSIDSSVPIVIYHYNDKFDYSHPRNPKNEIAKVEENFIKNANMEKMKLTEEAEERIKDNILIAINKPIFEIEENNDSLF